MSDVPAARWLVVGDHGQYAHAFPAEAGRIYRSYCGIGPGWYETGDHVAHCRKCERRVSPELQHEVAAAMERAVG